MTKHDLVIIGAGAAGLTAAIYAARAEIDFVVLEQDGWGGGQIASAHTVENYPGIRRVNGADLGENIKAHAENLGAKIELGIVDRVKDFGEYKEIVLSDGNIVQAKAVIAATGAVSKKLNIQNERKLTGRGVSYCAVCDGAFFAKKDVIVVGGGDTAVEDAIYLSTICESVTLVLRRNEFRAAKSRTEYLAKLQNVKIIYNSHIVALNGQDRLESVDIKNEKGTRTISASGLFIAVGTLPVTDYLKDLSLKTENGYIIADETCRTNVEGIFAAGDIRKKRLRQLVTAVSDGANAAYSAMNYLKEQ